MFEVEVFVPGHGTLGWCDFGWQWALIPLLKLKVRFKYLKGFLVCDANSSVRNSKVSTSHV